MRQQIQSAGASRIKHFFGPIYFAGAGAETGAAFEPVSEIEDNAFGWEGITGAGEAAAGAAAGAAIGADCNCFVPRFFKKSAPWSLACK